MIIIPYDMKFINLHVYCLAVFKIEINTAVTLSDLYCVLLYTGFMRSHKKP